MPSRLPGRLAAGLASASRKASAGPPDRGWASGNRTGSVSDRPLRPTGKDQGPSLTLGVLFLGVLGALRVLAVPGMA